MIEIIKNGDIFNSDCEALVNPVNCLGVMGAGLALKFKQKFPDMYKEYRYHCKMGYIKIGRIYSLYPSKNGDPKILNFPTKYHWRDSSDILNIALGMRDILDYIELKNIESIAIPALGCGLGGLDWREVKLILKYFFSEKIIRERCLLYPDRVINCKVKVYAPW